MEECSYQDVACWRSAASRDRVAISDTPNTRWFRHQDIGCAGLMDVGKGVRIKGVWVKPERRGAGIGTTMTEWLLGFAKAQNYEFIEAFAWNQDFYLAHRFKIVGKNAFGATKLRRFFKK